MSKATATKIRISQVRYENELQGERGEKLLRVLEVLRKDNPFVTPRQAFLQMADAGMEATLEKELNINQ